MVSGAALKVLFQFNETSTLNFSELCERTGYAPDLGGYYIRQLLAASCIEKTARGTYCITPVGKQHLILKPSRHAGTVLNDPRLCVMVLPIIGDKYVVMRRKRQPYIGYAEWPAQRVQFGQDLSDLAVTIMQERVGTQGQLRFVGFFRRVDLQGAMVFDDKLFAVYECPLAADASVAPETAYGHNELMTAAEVEVAERAPGALRDIMHFIQTPQPYHEVRYQLTDDEIAS